MSEDIARAVEAILDDLRDRRLLKYLFDPNPEICGAYGYVEQPIDLDVQREIAETLARKVLAVRASLTESPNHE